MGKLWPFTMAAAKTEHPWNVNDSDSPTPASTPPRTLANVALTRAYSNIAVVNNESLRVVVQDEA